MSTDVPLAASASTTTTTSTATPPPENANVECVGPTNEQAGKAASCEGCPNQKICSSGGFNSPEKQAEQKQKQEQIQQSLQNVSHVILVLSGKGGVGKSTVSAQLCQTLASQGYAVGLLDVDLCGPSAPRMILGDSYMSAQVTKSASGAWIPVYSSQYSHLACMSISFLLQDPNAAVVWRGPRKNGLIQQFLTEVDWTGETDGLDYLIIDTPPGTSDEHISTVQYLQGIQAVAGAIVVTTPEEVSMADVRKELNFCQKTKVPILGIIENMGQYTIPLKDLHFQSKDGMDITEILLQRLQEVYPEALEVSIQTEIFPRTGGGPKAMAEQYGIPYWGILPLDPNLLIACEHGRPFVEDYPTSPATHALNRFCQEITNTLKVDEV